MPRIARRITQWSQKDITTLFRASQYVLRHPGIDIKKAPKTSDIGRVLIVIPRKVGTAPQRNLIRRRIKAVFYENRLFDYPYDWLFFIKPAACALAFSDFQELIVSLIPVHL